MPSRPDATRVYGPAEFGDFRRPAQRLLTTVRYPVLVRRSLELTSKHTDDQTTGLFV